MKNGVASPVPSTPALRISRLSKTFVRTNGRSVKAIDDVSLDLERGEFLVLLGPSGCGKTTLLRAVAGLETPDEGKIVLGDRALFDGVARLDLPPERRQVGMVFQGYALWPHMTVAQNVAYPLRMRGITSSERARRVTEILEKMHISELGSQYPARISGGQQQRVALARALVCGDPLILFDEPLSNVDAKVREHLRLEILSMQRIFGFTALYVTHDQEEAMALATRIAVVGQGKVAQLGTAVEIYTRPATLDVARFIGSTNECVVEVGEEGALLGPMGTLRIDPATARTFVGRRAVLLSRPEHWRFADGEFAGAVAGDVVAASFLGQAVQHVVRPERAPELNLILRSAPGDLRPVGSRVNLVLDPTGPLLFPQVA